MRPFIAVVNKDRDSAYGLSFPDLPGCHAAADEADALTEAAREALDLWFEDAPPVEPSPIEAVRSAAAADLRDGAFLLAVPYAPAPRRRRARASAP